MSELLHCPLCGPGKVSLNPPSDTYRYGSINCPGCMLTLPGEIKDQRELIEVWNTRHVDAPSAGSPASAVTDLVASIRQAESMLSAHIEEFHDFDYPAHAIPTELQQLRDIQHHLLGSLIDENGEIYDYPAQSTAMTASAEPVAWIEFADNGNIRFWTDDGSRAEREQTRGRILRAFTLVDLVDHIARKPTSTSDAAREALKRAEQSFEKIRLTLVDKLEEPERSAFWEAVNARENIRAALSEAPVSAWQEKVDRIRAIGRDLEEPSAPPRHDRGSEAQ